VIKLLKSGKYTLAETFDHTKILTLDDKNRYAWIEAAKIGEILVSSQKKFSSSQLIAAGNYRLYEVKDEPDLTDLEHLELFVGEGHWQGYLLPMGLPNGVKRRRIVATNEIITKTTH
jgi:hypothetical protein